MAAMRNPVLIRLDTYSTSSKHRQFEPPVM
jgi:hypothetical protein